MESFFHSLKVEEIYRKKYATRGSRQDIFEYIEIYYNRVRAHSSIGYLSPVEFEAMVTDKSIGVHCATEPHSSSGAVHAVEAMRG